VFPFGSWALDFADVALVSIVGGVVIGQRKAVRVALATTVAGQLFTWATGGKARFARSPCGNGYERSAE
jgi:hypothetical protein